MGVEGIPINGHAVLPERPEGEKQGRPLGVVLMAIGKRRNGGAGMAGRELLASQRTQGGTRSTFQEEVVSLVFKILNCFRKLHGCPGMTGPISGIGGFRSGDGASRDRRDKRLHRSAQRDFGDGLAQRLNHGIHHRGVEGMRGVQMAADDVFRFELLLEFDDIGFRPRHNT